MKAEVNPSPYGRGKVVFREQQGSMRPDQDLVVAGYAGWTGTQVIARARREELLGWFASDYVEQIINPPPCEWRTVDIGNLEQWKEFGATECEKAGEGGIMTALWNLSGAYDVGIEFWLRQIPVKQQTIEICERYDVNPYRLLSDSCVILVADNGGSIVRKLEAKGIPSAVIGRVNPGIKREVYNGETRGFLERPRKDELNKVVPDYFE